MTTGAGVETTGVAAGEMTEAAAEHTGVEETTGAGEGGGREVCKLYGSSRRIRWSRHPK